MRPCRSILDRDFRYVPSVATSVAETWRRFGWRPKQKTERMQPPGKTDPRAHDAAGSLRPAARA
jgi:hypothetical protein